MKVYLEDLIKSRTPILNYCRKLIKEGIDPNTKLEVFRRNQDDPDVIVTNIGEAAKYTVTEGRHRPPRFVKIKSRYPSSPPPQIDKLEVV